MWVVGSAAFLVPAVLIAVQCLMRRQLPLQPQRLPKQTPRFPGVWQAVARGLGMRRGTAEAFSFVLIFVAAVLAFSTALALSGSDDDELALRAHQQSNNLDVAVYMPEGTLPVGENTVSVLVQNTSGGVLLDSPMELSLTQTGGGQRSLPVRESEAESPNKLLRSASMNLPEPGEWLMRVSITHAADSLSITLKVQSVSPHREFGDAWPQLVFPGFTVVLLLVYWQRHRHPMPRQAAQTAASH